MPAAEKRHVVENVLHVCDQVRGDDDGGLRVVVGDDGAENVVARRGVDAADRLVEQVELRLAAHDEDELHLFARALGHLLDLLLRLDAEPLHHLHGGRAVKVVVEVTEKVQQLQRRHPVGEIGALRQVGDDLLRVPARCHAVDEDFPGIRRQQAVCQLDERALAAPVRAEQTDDAPRLDREIHAVECRLCAVALAQPSAFENCHVC